MKLGDLPLISYVFEAGADNRVFDSLLLLGPLVIGLVVILGRSLLTEVLVVVYIAVFVTHALYQRDSGVNPTKQQMGSEVPLLSTHARMAGVLEHWLRWSVIWGTRGMLVSTALFVGYVVVG